MSSPAGYLFDLGNTLVDYHLGDLSDREKYLLGVDRIAVALERWRIEVPLDRLVRGVLLELHRLWERRAELTAEIPIEPVVAAAVAPAHLEPGQIRDLILAFHSPWIERAGLQPGAAELLRELHRRGTPVALVSNCAVPGYCHDATLAAIGLLDLMPVRLYSYDFGTRKPDPRIFEAALSELGLRPELCVMIGDSLRLDIEPARRLGLRTYHYVPSIEGRPTEGEIRDLRDALS